MKRLLLAVALLGVAVSAAENRRRIITDPGDDLIIPQVVSGGGWSTSIVLVNMDLAPAKCFLNFIDSEGNDVALSVEGLGKVSAVAADIPVNGSRRIQVLDDGSTTTQGWAFLSTAGVNGSTGVVSGMAVFRLRVPGRQDQEAVVPFSPMSETQSIIPFDNTADFATGVALVNPNAGAEAILIAMYDEDGVLIDSGSVQLGAFAHTAFSVAERFPKSAGKKGTIQLATTGQWMSALGLRFNPTGAFTSSHPLSGLHWY